jgi:hypothetical protein
MPEKTSRRKKLQYDRPRILASYTREELLETIRPHGTTPSYGGTGCGCGGGP